MKFITCILISFISARAISQVAINTDNSVADISAMLDVKSFSKGILIPRVTAAERVVITSPANGLLVFQTDEVSGFYYNAGTNLLPEWRLMMTNFSGWSLNGNNNVTSTNFLGTLDNTSLKFRINNLPAGNLDPLTQNISWGIGSLSSGTTGSNNIAIGWGALNHNTTGFNMVAIGDSALYSQVSSNAYFNTAVGSKALYANTTGYENSAFGNAALISNTIGTDNTAIGDGALRLNINGHVNTAVGLHALYNNVSGIYNSGMSAFSLISNTTGTANTAIGFFADVTAGDLNNCTAIGYSAKVDASDKVRIGNAAVTSIGGQVGWSTFSDGRFKVNLREDVPGISFIKKLRPVTYEVDVAALEEHYNSDKLLKYPTRFTDKNNGSRQSGFIAQEVELASYESGFTFSGVDKPANSKALYGLRYADFVVPMVKGMLEQQVIIEKQSQQITDLLSRITVLESKVDKSINKW